MQLHGKAVRRMVAMSEWGDASPTSGASAAKGWGEDADHRLELIVVTLVRGR